jgi:hypothetical protein
VNHLNRLTHAAFRPGVVIARPQRVIEHDNLSRTGLLPDQCLDFALIRSRALGIVIKIDIRFVMDELKAFPVDVQSVGERPGIGDRNGPGFVIALVTSLRRAGAGRQADRRRAVTQGKRQWCVDRIERMRIFKNLVH